MDMYVLVKSKGLALESPIPKLAKNNLIMNSYSLFLFNNEEETGKDYRGQITAITFEELWSGADSVRESKCCKRVGSIVSKKSYKLQDGTRDELFCFSMTGMDNTWQICHSEIVELEEYRAKIILAVLHKAGGDFHNPKFTYDLPYSLYPWKWVDQRDWPGLCESGLAQSPIHINTE